MRTECGDVSWGEGGGSGVWGGVPAVLDLCGGGGGAVGGVLGGWGEVGWWEVFVGWIRKQMVLVAERVVGV